MLFRCKPYKWWEFWWPLLNQSGNLIGIATFGTPENEGLNFAISVEEIIRFKILKFNVTFFILNVYFNKE